MKFKGLSLVGLTLSIPKSPARASAGLALHELLYHFALGQKRPPQNSNVLRHLNFIFGTDFSDVTLSV